MNVIKQEFFITKKRLANRTGFKVGITMTASHAVLLDIPMVPNYSSRKLYIQFIVGKVTKIQIQEMKMASTRL